mmetsp:Transcript_1429/g.3255  ORF Transcript_1429/g.3255 Transcript_1429/m.3255 type:complete len:129 (+) Transcript_1429:210-596(+)
MFPTVAAVAIGICTVCAIPSAAKVAKSSMRNNKGRINTGPLVPVNAEPNPTTIPIRVLFEEVINGEKRGSECFDSLLVISAPDPGFLLVSSIIPEDDEGGISLPSYSRFWQSNTWRSNVNDVEANINT